MPVSRGRDYRKLRRENSQLHARAYHLQEAVERLLQENDGLRRQLFQTDRTLVALLAQHGPQEITRGTFEQATADVQTTWRAETKDGDETTLVVHTQKTEGATAEAFASKDADPAKGEVKQ